MGCVAELFGLGIAMQEEQQVESWLQGRGVGPEGKNWEAENRRRECGKSGSCFAAVNRTTRLLPGCQGGKTGGKTGRRGVLSIRRAVL